MTANVVIEWVFVIQERCLLPKIWTCNPVSLYLPRIGDSVCKYVLWVKNKENICIATVHSPEILYWLEDLLQLQDNSFGKENVEKKTFHIPCAKIFGSFSPSYHKHVASSFLNESGGPKITSRSLISKRSAINVSYDECFHGLVEKNYNDDKLSAQIKIVALKPTESRLETFRKALGTNPKQRTAWQDKFELRGNNNPLKCSKTQLFSLNVLDQEYGCSHSKVINQTKMVFPTRLHLKQSETRAKKLLCLSD